MNSEHLQGRTVDVLHHQPAAGQGGLRHHARLPPQLARHIRTHVRAEQRLAVRLVVQVQFHQRGVLAQAACQLPEQEGLAAAAFALHQHRAGEPHGAVQAPQIFSRRRCRDELRAVRGGAGAMAAALTAAATAGGGVPLRDGAGHQGSRQRVNSRRCVPRRRHLLQHLNLHGRGHIHGARHLQRLVQLLDAVRGARERLEQRTDVDHIRCQRCNCI
jgi:hypothetical protein